MTRDAARPTYDLARIPVLYVVELQILLTLLVIGKVHFQVTIVD